MFEILQSVNSCPDLGACHLVEPLSIGSHHLYPLCISGVRRLPDQISFIPLHADLHFNLDGY